MRAAVLRAPKTITIEERPEPVPGDDEVIVKVVSVGVCGSDVHYYEDGRIGSFIVEAPLILGHEAAGEVVALGKSARRHAVGDRVSIEPGVPDRSCEWCLAGKYNLCPNMRFYATPPMDGAFVEYVAIHETFAHAVPTSLSYDAAALLEPLSVALWACQKGAVTAGSRVLVNGAGPIGLLCAQAAVAFGATQVTVADINPHRLQTAATVGAIATVDAREGRLEDQGVRAEVLLECAGVPKATADALYALQPGGRAVLVGSGPAHVPLPLSRVQSYELEISGLFRYANTWPTAIDLVASGRIDLDGMVTGRYPLEETGAALTAGLRDPASIKPIVTPHAHA